MKNKKRKGLDGERVVLFIVSKRPAGRLISSRTRAPLVLFAPHSFWTKTNYFELLERREREREKLSTFACRASRRLKNVEHSTTSTMCATENFHRDSSEWETVLGVRELRWPNEMEDFIHVASSLFPFFSFFFIPFAAACHPTRLLHVNLFPSFLPSFLLVILNRFIYSSGYILMTDSFFPPYTSSESGHRKLMNLMRDEFAPKTSPHTADVAATPRPSS